MNYQAYLLAYPLAEHPWDTMWCPSCGGPHEGSLTYGVCNRFSCVDKAIAKGAPHCPTCKTLHIPYPGIERPMHNGRT